MRFGSVSSRILRRSTWVVLLFFGMSGLARLVRDAVTTHFNSDLLFIEQIYRDFFVSRVGLSGWYLPPAPYYFPDWPIYFVLRALIGSAIGALWAYGFVIFGLICLGAWWLARETGCSSRHAAVLTSGGALSLVAALQATDHSMLVLFLPIFHSGALAIGLGLLALTLRNLREGITWAVNGAFFALCVLGAASDFFTVTQFMIPILLAVVWFTLGHRIAQNRLLNLIAIYGTAALLVVLLLLRWLAAKAGVRFDNNPLINRLDLLLSPKGLLAALVTATVLASCSWIWQVARRAALSLAVLLIGLVGGMVWWKLRAVGWAELGLADGWLLRSVRRFASDLALLTRASPQLWIIVLVCTALCLQLLRQDRQLGLSRAKGPTKDAIGRLPPQLFLAIFFLISTAIMIGESVLTWKSAGEVINIGVPIYIVGGVRHIQPLFVLPLFLLGLQLKGVWRPGRAMQRVVFALWSGWIILRTSPALWGLMHGGLLPQIPADPVNCLDGVATRSGVAAGYGDYWTTRHFNFLSRSGLRLAPLADEMELDFTCTNVHAFGGDPVGPATWPAYGFIVEGKLPRQAILKKFGPPAAEESCGSTNVLVYNRKMDVAFRNAFRIPWLTKFGLPLPSHIDGLPSLNIYRPPGTVADANNSVLVPAADRIEVHFLPAVSGDVLELAFAGERRAIATIESVGGTHAQDLIIGPVEGGSMQPRYVLLDKAWREMKIERLRLRVADAGGPLQLGYAFVYQDPRP